MSDIRTQRKMLQILRCLRDLQTPAGSERLAEELRGAGSDFSERTVRNYLGQADALGWTENLGRRGRRLTEAGLREVERALVIDKVGFVAARVEELAYRMDFDAATGKGKVILNVTTVPAADIRPALEELRRVFDARLGMGRLAALAGPGAMLGGFRVPKDAYAIGTVCSVTINGIFLRAHIAVTSRFGGLLELERQEPKRFVQIINYDGTSLDPLEIFIRGHMTSVEQAARTGSGTVGASFREFPMTALSAARALAQRAEDAGLGGVLRIGSPGQPLLDIPVGQGRVGLVVYGGLNPIAAIVESGIAVTSTAMCTLCDYDTLTDYNQLAGLLPPRAGLRKAKA